MKQQIKKWIDRGEGEESESEMQETTSKKIKTILQ